MTPKKAKTANLVKTMCWREAAGMWLYMAECHKRDGNYSKQLEACKIAEHLLNKVDELKS